jgi:alpha-N-acetylglucosaminidase
VPAGDKLLHILQALDGILMTSEDFMLSEWIASARASAGDDPVDKDFFEYDAGDQVTLWAPHHGPLADYAQKMWGGFISGYYHPRWQKFLENLKDTPVDEYAAERIRQWLVLFKEN